MTEHTLKLDDDAERPEADIDRVSWMSGAWKGDGLGGAVEEVWSDPSVGTMVGMFKLMREGKPTMYELELIVEEEGSLTWKVRHFGSDFTAWEEKDEFVSFPLVKLTEDGAYFNGLTVLKNGEDGLSVYLAMPTEDGIKEAALDFKRVR
jgi:hypothetical protein